MPTRGFGKLSYPRLRGKVRFRRPKTEKKLKSAKITENKLPTLENVHVKFQLD